MSTLDQGPIPAAFEVGQSVLIKTGPAEDHCRTPSYLRGRRGRIIEVVGFYKNPSLLAFHKPGLPKLWLYRVKFDQPDIWGSYAGNPRDSVVADIYEHWLIAA